MPTAVTKRRPYLAACLGAIAVCFLTMSGLDSRAIANQAHVRRISYSFEPIATQLRPDDQVVLIDREIHIVRDVPAPTASQLIDATVAQSDLVAIAELSDIEGVLVDQGRWIDTRLMGKITEVFKLGESVKIAQDNRIEVQFTGGQLMFGKVLVKAGRVFQLQSQRSYLVFLAKVPEMAAFFPTHIPLLIQDGQLASPESSDAFDTPPNPDPLHGMSLSDVVIQIRRLAK